jgi:hypothetical protein
LTKEEAAAALDGGEYREEGSKELFARMAEAGLVAVFGASDDLMEFRGAIYDETGAYGGTNVRVSPEGLLEKCDDRCHYYRRAAARAVTIKALWAQGGYSWRYETGIPHATFVINEDGEPYCEGIVFALADAVL